MTEQSSDSQRHSHPGATDVPGADDMLVAPDEAMARGDQRAGDPQQTDPGGYPHEPSPDVPRLATDAGGGEHDVVPPAEAAGPGEHNAQVTPNDEDERRRKGSA